ncbi:MAG: DNA adenine methylase [Betaproteobacteria bacterium]|nr:DNA adenine methylase [Betaproteobacteria bacterium]
MLFNISDRARPVLKWAGGKSALLEQLVPHFPQSFDRYIEPFLGGGAVFFSLCPGVRALLNELNPELFNLYCVIRDKPDQLMQQLDEFAQRYSKEFYYELRSQAPRTAVARAARTLFLNKTGFNGLYRQNARGQFNVPFGHRKKCPALYNSENIRVVSRRLAEAEINNADFATVIAQAGEGDFLYCDPPYEPLSATSSFNSYTSVGFNRSEQKRLHDELAKAVARGAHVALSNSVAPYVVELYAHWDVRRVKARRTINSIAGRRGEIDEFLVLMKP